MDFLGINSKELIKLDAIHTAKEINQQPYTWIKTINQIKEMKDEIKAFIDQVLINPDYDVIFSGAGTSEFIGNALFSDINLKTNFRARSYATTDITTNPKNYISKDKPTLLVSFGRSGNSPESIGAIDNAEAISNKIYNLFITCNKNGKLSKRAETEENCFAINLTPETHDLGFAMTSSFSNMYLAAYLVFNLDNLDKIEESYKEIIKLGHDINKVGYKYFEKLVDDYDFNRIVYLGSNVLKGVAQESALKMLELTAGKVVTLFDTPLGFRHGPKSILNDKTLTVVYLSDNAYARKYELDLVKEIVIQRKNNKILVVCNTPCLELNDIVDYIYCFGGYAKENVELALLYTMCAQLISFYKSLSLGITTDNPCPSGDVNRVVKGVVIYKYKI
ncbi:MAG TPA: SIS domain-containing protein [Erysipelotrichaceae bacterium]|jgi:tagatose-6-phosphate ketose/aldose isomerase|nr:SIS domain-containing protein [Erysipelotrichia bacterium]HPX32148.1 SIS domain-containing protein [Erysipelotrichaceae bacterium]HQA84519.1 SIS domain-containing protein [Erysipelotrichaceae bacterium]